VRPVWQVDAPQPEHPSLRGDARADVLVIGGGMAGLLTAWQLREAGVDVLLLERNRICSATTAQTTAKITAQHGLIYDRLLREFGLEKAQMYLHANRDALEEYRSLCRSIDCDFQERRSGVYALNDRRKIEKELDALQKIGFPAEFAAELPLPFPVVGAVCFEGQAQFHPLKFLSAVAQGLCILTILVAIFTRILKKIV